MVVSSWGLVVRKTKIIIESVVIGYRQKARKFTDLEVWKLGHQLAIGIYQTTRSFPKEETYSLVDQMMRAAVSITSNIAEGFSRQTKKEKIQFYSIAKGSLTELQNQLLLANDIGYIKKTEFMSMANQTVSTLKLLNGLIRSMRS